MGVTTNHQNIGRLQRDGYFAFGQRGLKRAGFDSAFRPRALKAFPVVWLASQLREDLGV